MKKQNIVNTETIMTRGLNSMNGDIMYGREFTEEEISRGLHKFMIGGQWDEFQNF